MQRPQRQERNLPAPLAQRRDRDGARTKAIAQILEQQTLRHERIRSVRHRKNHAARRRLQAIATNGSVCPAIQDLQQLLLHAEIQRV